ncbi:YdcF family protein [Bryobacter aggregatus]|uniref:YdcF family protein n=1 Tax=Bryobacter aggregatus TaxID=360054 RepID=UPI0004E21041|nr:YdcF family protein [Bryobacter aggregatus]
MKKILTIAAVLLFLIWGYQVTILALAVRDQAQKEEARPSEVIVVLGAAEYKGKPSPVFRSRLDHAFDLYMQKMAPRVLTTGGSGGERVHTEAEVGRQYLADRGIPVENIYVEREGATTAQTTAASAEILKRMGWNTCILVSDGYHLFRAKKMMTDYGLDCVGSPRPAKDAGYLQTGWLYLRQAVGYSLFDLGIRF